MDKINVAKLLKDCPKGMELDCIMFEGVYFDHVDESRHNKIKCYVNNGNEHFEIAFDENGKYISNKSAKCVIFPKGKTTWEGFVPPCKFKDGDILYMHASNSWIFIYREGGEKENICYKYVAITEAAERLHFVHDSYPLCHLNLSKIEEIRHATEEEKAKLFQTIKDNGYMWNPETKTLEKLVEPKFKVGDRIKRKDADVVHTIKEVGTVCYVFDDLRTIYINVQDNYKLVSNKFDINTLVPFESRVLVRHNQDNKWCGSFFSHLDEDLHSHCYKFVTTSGKSYRMCIPFEGNEHLLGKTYDCDELYKTWK